MSTDLLLTVFVLIYLVVTWKSGKNFPILHLFIFVYFIQYLFSSYLIYYEYPELHAQMAISAERYFAYAVPACLALFAGVLLFNKNVDMRPLLSRIDKAETKKLGYWLLAVSYFFDVLGQVGIPGMASILSFTHNLKFIAAFCFLFVGSTMGYFIIAVVYMHLAYEVLRAGVFINFMIWASYLYFFAVLKFRFSFLFRSSFILIAIPLLVLIQSIKEEYRSLAWKGKREGGIQLFTELAGKEKNNEIDEPLAQSKGLVSTIGRLSEGWHVGLTMRHVPARQPFVNGEELLSDIVSSFLPRLAYSDKKIVGTQEKFEKYTGHRLINSTAMSIGILGDFYINFGQNGAVIGLFILGVLIALFLNYFIRRYVLPIPINIVWIPFVLNYLIRAGNDFYAFFNGSVKGFVLFLIFNFYYQRYLKRRRKSVAASRVAANPTRNV